MKLILLSSVIAAFSFSAQMAFAKDYQVTGLVTEVSDTKIIVDKKGEKFEIAKLATTASTGGDLKVGQKVTVYYSMSANKIEAKADSKPAKASKK